MIYHSCLLFTAFTPLHWLPVLTIFKLGGILFYLSHRYSHESKYKILVYLSLLPLIGYLMYLIGRIYFGLFDYKSDLPLHICRMLAVASPIIAINKNRFWIGIFYFWVMAGTLGAIISPDLKVGYDHYEYWSYWILHCGLVVVAMYYIVVLKVHITWTDLKYAFWMANLYMLLSLIINNVIESNYMYTNGKPESATILDYFGEWPIYIFVTQMIGTLLFVILWLPFYIKIKIQQKTNV